MLESEGFAWAGRASERDATAIWEPRMFELKIQTPCRRWRLALPSLLQREVIIMTAYEILTIVLMIITLVFTVHIANHR